MPKGKANSRFNFIEDSANTNKPYGCKYENGTWCKLPKFKRCMHVIRCKNGDKACEVTAF